MRWHCQDHRWLHLRCDRGQMNPHVQVVQRGGCPRLVSCGSVACRRGRCGRRVGRHHTGSRRPHAGCVAVRRRHHCRRRGLAGCGCGASEIGRTTGGWVVVGWLVGAVGGCCGVTLWDTVTRGEPQRAVTTTVPHAQPTVAASADALLGGWYTSELKRVASAVPINNL